MKMFLVRVAFVSFVTLNVFCFAWMTAPATPVKTTIGAIAEKSSDFSDRRVILGNCILGERKGRFIRFKATVDHRHDVLFVLRYPDSTPQDCTVFSGYCYGIESGYDDCPFEGPFLLIEYVTPAP